MNLTRNVRIEGTAAGPAHVFIRSSRPQSIRYTQIRHVSVLTMGDASQGITFRDDISYNNVWDAFWWDPSPNNREPGDPTNDTLIDGSIVAKSLGVPDDNRDYRLSAFNLGMGRNNTVRNSTAGGTAGSAGFGWPEDAGQNLPGNGVWTFNQGNVSHNNHDNGLFVWQNTDTLHDVSNFVSYHNVSYGIEHGGGSSPHGLVSFDHVAEDDPLPTPVLRHPVLDEEPPVRHPDPGPERRLGLPARRRRQPQHHQPVRHRPGRLPAWPQPHPPRPPRRPSPNPPPAPPPPPTVQPRITAPPPAPWSTASPWSP